MVFDFDDAIWKNDTSAANRMFAWLKRPEKINYTIAQSAMVLAGNAYLVHYATHFNQRVQVITTTIDTAKYQIEIPMKTKEEGAIGWTGSHNNV